VAKNCCIQRWFFSGECEITPSQKSRKTKTPRILWQHGCLQYQGKTTFRSERQCNANIWLIYLFIILKEDYVFDPVVSASMSTKVYLFLASFFSFSSWLYYSKFFYHAVVSKKRQSLIFQHCLLHTQSGKPVQPIRLDNNWQNSNTKKLASKRIKLQTMKKKSEAVCWQQNFSFRWL
jgi:hypothetical protein